MPASTDDPLIRKELLTLGDGHKLTLTIVGTSNLPVLLFVIGSSGFGRLYHRLALELSQHFQCVYYDKRGYYSELSSIQPDPTDSNNFTPVSQHVADAAAVIKHLSPSQPAYVFGSSTGGTAVLDLLLQHPDLVHTAILHEPILLSIVPAEQGQDELIALYHRILSIPDPVDAMAQLGRANFFTSRTSRLVSPPIESPTGAGASTPPQTQTQTQNKRPPPSPRDALTVHNMRQTQLEGAAMLAYRVDVARARQLRDRIVILGGVESSDLPVAVMGRALAGVLEGGKRVWDVPGGHASFAGKERVSEFKDRSVSVLRRERRLGDEGRREDERGRAKI